MPIIEGLIFLYVSIKSATDALIFYLLIVNKVLSSQSLLAGNGPVKESYTLKIMNCIHMFGG